MWFNNGLTIQWFITTESSSRQDYKKFPIVFEHTYLVGWAHMVQETSKSAYLAWLNNEQKELDQCRVGLGNDWTATAGYYINVFVIGC